jgi:hypothetical protein
VSDPRKKGITFGEAFGAFGGALGGASKESSPLPYNSSQKEIEEDLQTDCSHLANVWPSSMSKLTIFSEMAL